MTKTRATLVHDYHDIWTQSELRSATACLTRREKLTYSELIEHTARVAGGLVSRGVRRGDLVAIAMARSMEQLLAILGTMIAGACPCPMESRLSSEETSRRLAAVGMRWLIHDAGQGERLETVDFSPERRLAFNALRDGNLYWNYEIGPDDPGLLLFTSGSTGQPKGVLLSHRSLRNNARGVVEHTRLTPADRLLHVMPLYHTNGLNNQLFAPLLAGAAIALADRFKAEEMPALMEAFRPSIITAVPTMYSRMLGQTFTAPSLQALRFARCGSAPITVDLHERIEAFLGCDLVVSYGLSEATCTSTMNPPERRKVGSVGTVLSGQRVYLRDSEGNELTAPGQEGEICIAGPNLMLGYLGIEAAKASSPVEADVLRTGDLGHFDEDGYLYVTGRIKDVIIRGGENLSPSLIEGALVKHPDVAACCVIGMPDTDLGEVPVAFVVPVKGKSLDTEELQDEVVERLGRIYRPAKILTMEKLPETSVGKVDRKALSSQLEGPV